MLFYNEKLLADAGVAVPTSFAEYQTAVAAMTKPDAGVFGLSAVTTEHPTVAEDLHRYIGYAGTSVIKDGKYNLTSPEVIAAVETYRNVVGKNAPLGNNSAVAHQLFPIAPRTACERAPATWCTEASSKLRKMSKAPAVAAPPSADRPEQDQLIDRCLAGDPAAWDRVVRTYWKRVFNIAYKFVGRYDDAEDLTAAGLRSA